MSEARLKLLVLGVSSGGLEALKLLVRGLPADFPLPILAVQHLSPEAGDGLARLLDQHGQLAVKEADLGERPRPGTLYLAPANYHLQVEPDGCLSLATDAPVHFARPSVDVLFETAARAHGPALAGIILTGAGCDGSRGLRAIQEHGGLTIIQEPGDALCDGMPLSALGSVQPDHRVILEDLPGLLLRLATPPPPEKP